MKDILIGLRQRIVPVLVLSAIGITPLFAIDVKFTPPVFAAPGVPGLLDYVNALNAEAANVYNDLRDEIYDEVKNIDTNPSKMIRAFADA